MNDRSSNRHPAQNDTARKGSGEGPKSGTTSRVKQAAAIIGIILLVAMYVVTLVAACMGSDSKGRLFRLCLGMTIAVPIFLWIFIWCVGVLTRKGSMADMDLLDSNPVERAKMEKEIRDLKDRESTKTPEH